MTRRRKAVLSLVFGIAALIGTTFVFRKKAGDAQALAIRAAQSVGAEGAEDLLRYSSHCRDTADFWILSTQGADALWEKQCDRKGHYRLWFRADERPKGFRVLRQLTYGPAPKDDEFHWLIEKLRDHAPTSEQNFGLFFWSRLPNATSKQREWAELTLMPLARSPDSKDRIFYAARAEWSNSPKVKETLITLLEDADAKVVAQAILATAFQNQIALEPRMKEFLESSIPEIRHAAWTSSIWFRKNRDIQNRVRRGLWSVIPDDRAIAISSMTYQLPPGSREVSRVRALLGDSDQKVRLCAIVALGRWKDAPSLPLLESLTNHQDIRIRTAAVRMLGINSVRSVLPIARKWLHSTNESERVAGVLAVWRLNDRASLPEIEKLENDPSLQYLVPEILQQWRPKNKAVDLFQKAFQLPFGQ